MRSRTCARGSRPRWVPLLVGSWLGLAACHVLPAAAAPSVSVGETTYTGVSVDSGQVAAFLGLPFARPPLGAQRWRPPEPLQSPPAELRADAFAPACMQGRHMVDWYRDLVQRFGGDPATFPVPVFSEDCLYLNVWTPAPGRDADLPVMVWIHGGGHRGGWSFEPNYVGDALARQGVVVVSIAYRLDVFGFFSHPELPQANLGLLDQAMALAWVRDNIRAFGGDPHNVTVFGESAGGASIGYLLASPAAKGLFHRAIVQSAGYQLVNRDRREDFLDRGLALQRHLLGEGGNLEALRQVPPDRLLAAVAEIYADYQHDVVVDGITLTETALASLASGRMRQLDLLIGSNADEWRMYLDADTGAGDVARWIDDNAPGQQPALLGLLAGEPSPLYQLDRLYTAQQFVCPSLLMAQQAALAGKAAHLYYFTRQREGAGGQAIGAYHGAEIPYLFDKHDGWLPTTALDRQIGQLMQGYWINFARGGDPNGAGLPGWPPYREGEASTLRIGDTIGAIAHPEAALCASLGPRRD